VSIIRGPRPDSNFYILDKKISEDKRLSWAGRGLLIYLLGKPNHWQVSVQALINETKASPKPTGRDATWSLLRELIEAGYCTRTQARKADGTLGEMDYMISEDSSLHPLTAEPCTAEPLTAEPCTANPTQVSIDLKQGLKNTEQGLKKSADAPAPRTAKAGLEMPDGVDPQVWADFLTMRKAKRATLTATALAGIEREAVKAGVSLTTAIAACCEYGWQGFNATWYTERQALATQAYGAPAAQRPQPSRYQPAPPRYAAAGAAIFGNQLQNFDDGRTIDA
jgi:hypothetical protein